MQFNVLRSVTSSIIWRFKIHSNQFVTKSQHMVYFCPKKFQSAKQKSISHFFYAFVTPNLKIVSKETLIASFLYYFITFQWNFAHAIGQLFKLSFRMNFSNAIISPSQPAFTCSNLTTEALEQGVKNVQS